MNARERPLGIAILALMQFVGSAAALVLLVIVPALVSSIVRVNMPAAQTGQAGQVSSTLLNAVYAVRGVLTILAVVIALVGFAVGYGLWKGMAWSWWLEVIGAVLGIASILVLNVVGFAAGAILLFYLTRKGVKAYFGM